MILQMRACTRVTLDNEFVELVIRPLLKKNQQSRKISRDNVIKFNLRINSHKPHE